MAKCQFSKMTKEQRAEYGRQGGIKSGETKRKKKAMKEALEVLLAMPIKSGKCADVEDIKNFAALRGKNISVSDAMLIAQIQKALKGDTQALAFLRDTSGQKPDDKVNIAGSIPVVISGENDLED